MAYAAVSSFLHMIKGLVRSSRISVASTRESLGYALDLATSLLHTLRRCSEALTALEEQIIIEEARRLEDAIQLPLYTHLVSQSQSVEPCPSRFSLHLDHIRQDVDCFAKMAKEMKQNIDKLWEQKAAMVIEEYVKELFVQKTAEEEDASSATDEREMVGLSDQFHMIRDKLAAGNRGNKIWKYDIFVWISGMAGIGKTRLAKRIYHDPLVRLNFERQAFVRVGQEFWLREVLQDIAAQLNLDYDEVILEGDKNLHESFCRILTAGKFLIVLDDVWEEETLVGPLLYLKEYSGSRILVTSRTDSSYAFIFKLKMRFMNEEESWELLRREVFGEEKCPSELVKAGKKIAEKCEGLPLLIITVTPILLSKAQKNPQSWKRIAEKPKSVLEDASYQISEVLLSSFHRISEELKLCFLYIAAFPLTYIVRHSMILYLWCAEGFIDDDGSFNILVDRNLVVERQKCWSTIWRGNKACSLHTAYWYLSKREAKNNKFLYAINSCADDLNESVEVHRRLAIHENVLLAIKEVHNKITAI